MGHFPPECGRLRDDLMEVYKIITSRDKVDDHSLFLGVGVSKNRRQRFLRWEVKDLKET